MGASFQKRICIFELIFGCVVKAVNNQGYKYVYFFQCQTMMIMRRTLLDYENSYI